VPSAHHGGTKTDNPDQVLHLGRTRNLNARGLFQWSAVGSMLGVGSNDWAHFTGKHFKFPNVLFVCQIFTKILWNYVMFLSCILMVLYIHDITHSPNEKLSFHLLRITSQKSATVQCGY
jgi:hypothetical protein